MDIYTEVQSSDAADLINSPFSGRFCGPVPPRRRVSLYRSIALSFYTIKNETTPDVFTGTYTFIPDCTVNKDCGLWSLNNQHLFPLLFLQLNSRWAF